MSNMFNKVDWQRENDYWETSKQDVQYRIWVENKKLFIAYQCSMSEEDFSIAFDMIPKKVGGMYYHRGFYNAFNKSKINIISNLFTTMMTKNIEEIILIGYSEGAVYASLLYSEIKDMFNIKISTYAYACPNFIFLSRKKAKEIFKDVNYIVNKNDLVCMFPFLYTKYGKLTMLDNNSKIPSTFMHLHEYYERSLI